MNQELETYILEATKATSCEEVEIIQSLWSDYGKISRYRLSGSSLESVVVKNIMLEEIKDHPRGWSSSFSHNRKVKSYEVEMNWYRNYNDRCIDSCRTPEYLGSHSSGNNHIIIMEDLDYRYPIRRQEVELEEVKLCLSWLAHFHMKFMNQNPAGLWKIGTYWNLGTRPDEYEKIKYEGLKNNAHIIDNNLNNCQFKTFVHGDAKLANFCFSADGHAVAAVDFQYVGGGCGMKDVVYLIGSCLSGKECEMYENELLNYYFSILKEAHESTTIDMKQLDIVALEAEWREMYPLASADFTRFMLGWMPTHTKINDYSMELMERVLAGL